MSRPQAYDPYAQSQHGATNNALYYESGDEMDRPFDVRADFDAVGPRWSERSRPISQSYSSKGLIGNLHVDESSYKPVNDHVAPTGHRNNQMKEMNSREEMVSVPVLGPEWKRTELHELSRRGQSEMKSEKRTIAWREWTRDQRGMFGVKWLTRKVFVFFMFAFVVGLALILYFLIPRAPSFEFYQDEPFTVDNSTINFNRSPTNFSFSGNLNLYGDGSSSYLPVHFTSLKAQVYDYNTNKQVASGDWGNHYLAKKSQQPVVLPVTFSYSAINTSDTTWNDFYNACGHIWTGTVRTDLKLKVILTMSIVGLTTHPVTSTSISGVTCPFELSATSV